jgi:putative ABC transport system ATP-binding protein
LLLADEPTAALDAENGLKVMALLSELARDSSRAILAVTHDNRTLPYADRIVHIEDGRIVGEERQTPKGREPGEIRKPELHSARQPAKKKKKA